MNSSKKLFYGMFTALLLGGAIAAYGIYWANGQLKTRSEQIVELDQEVSAVEEKIINARALEAELRQKEDIAATLEGVLPDSKAQENIVGEIIAIAAKSNISLDSIAFTGGTGGNTTNYDETQTQRVDGIPGVLSISMDTSVTSSYANILQLLSDIENNKRRFEVTEINISPNEAEGVVVDYTAELDIITYIRP